MRPKCNTKTVNDADRKERELELITRYGDLLNLSDIAKVLRYPNTHAVRMAHLRHALPFNLVRIPNRRGWFATAKAVAAALTQLDNRQLTSKSPAVYEDSS
jgi:hypothetical protein